MKRFARSILDVKDKQTKRTTDLFKRLGWMPIDTRIKYFEGIQMYNIFHHTAPKYMCDSFTDVRHVHKYNTRTRDNDNFRVPAYKLGTGQRAFKYRGTVLWNGLNQHIKPSPTVAIFKVRYTHFLKTELYDKEHFF